MHLFVDNTASPKQVITKMFKILKFRYIFSHYIYVFSSVVAASLLISEFYPLSYGGQCSLVLVTLLWFFHKFNKRYMFICHKRSSSDNLLTQSCLLIPVSDLVVRYSHHILNPLITLEKLMVFWFQVVEKGCIGYKWLKSNSFQFSNEHYRQL